MGERIPGPQPHAKFNPCGFKNEGLSLQPPKLPKMVTVV